LTTFSTTRALFDSHTEADVEQDDPPVLPALRDPPIAAFNL